MAIETALSILIIFSAALWFIMAGLGGYLFFIRPRRNDPNLVEFKNRVEQEKKDNPNRNRPIYDDAYTLLMSYIGENKTQYNLVLFLTIIFTVAGFSMIGIGIWMSGTVSGIGQSWLPIMAVIINEFIATTILFVYRSILNKTAEYSRILERMSSIRAAIQILDDLADDQNQDQEHKNKVIELQGNTKAEVAKLLLQLQHGNRVTEEGRK